MLDDDNDFIAKLEVYDQRLNGPEKGGATGDDTGNVIEGYVALPLQEANQAEDELIESALQRDVLDFPDCSDIFSDYNIAHSLIMVFPMLFPYGDGDVANCDHNFKVPMTKFNWHLFDYTIESMNESSRSYYHVPFAEHL